MLKKNSGSKEYTLRFHHSIEQLQYVEYKRSILDSYELTTNGGNRGLYFGHYYMKNSGRWYDDVEYMSRTHPVFSYWESLTYEHVAGRRRVKHLCKEMLDNLGPEALAIWFCDDGSLNAYKRTKSYGRPDRDMFGYGMNMFIHAESFTVHEQGLLIGVLNITPAHSPS